MERNRLQFRPTGSRVRGKAGRTVREISNEHLGCRRLVQRSRGGDLMVASAGGRGIPARSAA